MEGGKKSTYKILNSMKFKRRWCQKWKIDTKSKTRGQVVGVRCQLVIHANFRRGPTNRLLKASPAEEKKPGNFIFAHRTNCLQACLSEWELLPKTDSHFVCDLTPFLAKKGKNIGPHKYTAPGGVFRTHQGTSISEPIIVHFSDHVDLLYGKQYYWRH